MSEAQDAASQDKDQQPDSEDNENKMPFLEHLEELRSRLVYAAIAVGVGFLAAFAVKEELYRLLSLPLLEAMPAGSKFQFTAPAEAFFTYLKVSFLAGLVAASPVIFYQLWRFISPGLYDHERKAIWPFVIFSSLLFIVGSIFAYAVVFPYAFSFFSGFVTPDIEFRPKMAEYLSFTSTLLLAFGVVFEMPLVLVFLGRMGVVTHQTLRKQRKYAILIMFIAGALFTPPDVISQILMAMPLLVLYEISIWLVAASQKKKEAKQAAEEAEFAGEDDEDEAPKDASRKIDEP